MTRRRTLTHLDRPSCGGISLTHEDLRKKSPEGYIYLTWRKVESLEYNKIDKVWVLNSLWLIQITSVLLQKCTILFLGDG